MKTHTSVGLNVHQVDTQVTLAEAGHTGEVRLYGTITHDLHAMERPSCQIRIVSGSEECAVRSTRSGREH